MQLNILTKNAYVMLTEDLNVNIEKYAESEVWIDEYFSSKSMDRYYRFTGISVPDFELEIGGPETDADNARILYEALKDTLNPRIASDARLWLYLTHKTFYSYMVRRWPVQNTDGTEESEKNEKSVSRKQKIYNKINERYFFGSSNGKAFVRQGIARLYWSAALTYDENNSDPYEMTRFLLNNQDLLVATTERSLARNKNFLLAVLKVLRDYGPLNRADIRAYLAEVNRACGTGILDALSSDHAYELCEQCLNYVMSLPAVKKGSRIKGKNLEDGDIITLNAASKGVYSGDVLMQTSPKSIIGLRTGKRFSYGKHKTKVKIIEVQN